MASNDPLFDDLEPLTDDLDPLTDNLEPLTEDLEPLADDLEPLEDELDPLSADMPLEAADDDPLGLGNMELETVPATSVAAAPVEVPAELPVAADSAEGVPEASDEEYDDDDEYEDDDTPRLRRFSLRSLLQGIGACGFSMIVHVIGLVILGLMTFDSAIEAASQLIVASAPQEEIEDPPVEIELQEEIEVVTEQTVSVFSAAPAVGIAGGGPVAAGSPTLDMTLVEKAETTEIHIDAPTIGMPDSTVLVEA
ncbi:MAG TPA: hypothetical protein P5307_15790, partial [Pirellulaceae bacterium]|nr:hypothetical protein [Pirellulaceae bacterium]